MKLIQLGLMHGGIWPEDDYDDDNYRKISASSKSIQGEMQSTEQLAPLPKRIRDLVERRKKDRDSEIARSDIV